MMQPILCQTIIQYIMQVNFKKAYGIAGIELRLNILDVYQLVNTFMELDDILQEDENLSKKAEQHIENLRTFARKLTGNGEVGFPMPNIFVDDEEDADDSQNEERA